MQQKTMSIPFLLFGISVILIIMNSCGKKNDYQVKAKYFFINETDANIYFQDNWSKFNLNSFETIVDSIDTEGSKDVTCYDFTSPLLGCDPCIIMYSDNKCDTFYYYDNRGPINIVNFECNKVSERNFEFRFRFTKELQNEANNCQ
jgi:hypothetical protein